MPSLTHHPDTVFIGLDVHKDSISAGILRAGQNIADVERIFNDEASVRRLLSVFDEPRLLRVCYEAGPTGFDLARMLWGMGVACEVIAPSMIPKAPGDKVKTDTRDCQRLARLHRSGDLVAIRIPSPTEEAVRDVCRTRGDMVEDLNRARNRLGKFLLRHSRIWRGGTSWTMKHEWWLKEQSFDEEALQTTFEHYRAIVASREAQLAAVEADLLNWTKRTPFAEPVRRLAAYRGVTAIGALSLQAEVCDWRRFGRASQMMGFVGLVPTEYSSGAKTRRGHITKAGNIHLRTQLVEAAWQYQHRPNVGATIAKRQEGLPPEVVARSWAAQLRLCGRFRHLAAHKDSKSVVAAAVARELAGFLWAEMTA
jgi:transposase